MLLNPFFYGDRISYKKNSSFTFFGSDDESRFLKNKAELGQSWKYYDTAESLTYDYDNFGFRNYYNLEEIQYNPYIVTVGCSHTMGTGLFQHETYSHRLEKLLGMPVYNMGLTASSNEVSAFNLIWLLTNFNAPKVIVFQKTGIDRFPIIAPKSGVVFAGPWFTADNDYTRNMRDVMVASDELGYNQTKFRMLESMLTQIAKKLDTPIFFLTNEIIEMPEFDNQSRDRLHGGAEFNQYLAEYVWLNIRDM